MKIKFLLGLCAIGIFFRCNFALATTYPRASWTGSMFGSSVSIKIASGLSDNCSKNIGIMIRRFEKDFSDNLSTYSPQSNISKINHGELSTLELPSQQAELFAHAKWIQRQSSGIYDITVSPYWMIWSSFLHGQSPYPPSSEELHKLQAAKKKQDWEIQNLQLHSHLAQFQLDSLAPGLAMDLIAKKLWERGCHSYLVEVGGEVLAQGPHHFSVGIESPDFLDTLPKFQANLNNLSIGTSGLGRKGRFYQGKWFSNFIDARTGENINHNMIQVSVAHRLGVLADGLATLMMLWGPNQAWKYAQEKKIPLLMFVRGDDEKLNVIANKFWVQKLPTVGEQGKLLPHENWPVVTPSAGL